MLDLSFQIFLVSVAIIFVTVLVGLFPSIFEIWNKQTRKLNSRALLVYFFMILFLVCLMVIQNSLNDQTIQQKEDKSALQHTNDSLLLKRYQDSSTNIVQKGIDSGIKLYGEKLASGFGQQKTLIDSLLKNDTTKTFFNEIEPDLDFDSDQAITLVKQNNNQAVFKVAFYSKEAKSSNVKINLYGVTLTTKIGYSKIDKFIFSDGRLKISKDEQISTQYRIDLMPSDTLKVLFLVAKGTYTSNLGKRLSFYSISYFDIKENKFFGYKPNGPYPFAENYFEKK